MGKTHSGAGALPAGRERAPGERVLALAGNPNVGKSTVFNGLTGMRQHTGNWPGKTVVNAEGRCLHGEHGYTVVDLPGTYSLLAHSAEEETARNFLCFGGADAVVVVCDATCLLRSMNLVLQAIETGARVLVCVNLLDEAARKHISVDLDLLSRRLSTSVVGVVARSKHGLTRLLDAAEGLLTDAAPRALLPTYPAPVEEAIALVESALRALPHGQLNTRFLALRLLDPDASLLEGIDAYLGEAFLRDPALTEALAQANALLHAHNVTPDGMQDAIVTSLLRCAEEVCDGAVTFGSAAYDAVDRRLDRVLTGRRTAFPVMLALLTLVFFLTIVGANYPSELLSNALFALQDRLTALMLRLNAPAFVRGVLIDGVYRVLAWVVSVMLPPMAIFFPLFTLLEDAGYLPRVAYNLDKPFQRCRACGKQALCMCVGCMGMRIAERNTTPSPTRLSVYLRPRV